MPRTSNTSAGRRKSPSSPKKNPKKKNKGVSYQEEVSYDELLDLASRVPEHASPHLALTLGSTGLFTSGYDPESAYDSSLVVPWAGPVNGGGIDGILSTMPSLAPASLAPMASNSLAPMTSNYLAPTTSNSLAPMTSNYLAPMTSNSEEEEIEQIKQRLAMLESRRRKTATNSSNSTLAATAVSSSTNASNATSSAAVRDVVSIRSTHKQKHTLENVLACLDTVNASIDGTCAGNGLDMVAACIPENLALSGTSMIKPLALSTPILNEFLLKMANSPYGTSASEICTEMGLLPVNVSQLVEDGAITLEPSDGDPSKCTALLIENDDTRVTNGKVAIFTNEHGGTKCITVKVAVGYNKMSHFLTVYTGTSKGGDELFIVTTSDLYNSTDYRVNINGNFHFQSSLHKFMRVGLKLKFKGDGYSFPSLENLKVTKKVYESLDEVANLLTSVGGVDGNFVVKTAAAREILEKLQLGTKLSVNLFLHSSMTGVVDGKQALVVDAFLAAPAGTTGVNENGSVRGVSNFASIPGVGRISGVTSSTVVKPALKRIGLAIKVGGNTTQYEDDDRAIEAIEEKKCVSVKIRGTTYIVAGVKLEKGTVCP